MTAYSIDERAKIGGISLQVADITRVRRFYGEMLGFRIDDRGGGVLALRAGDGPTLILVEQRPNALPRLRRATGLYHFAIRLPSRLDLARLLRHAVSANLRFEGASDHGVSEALYLTDPEGNGIEIYIDRPRSTWRTQDGRLDMGTEPLDVDGILATLTDDTPAWAGMPAGSDIGHVHLQVAELAPTERFYCNGLGLQLQMRYGDSALFMSAGGYHHHVGANTWLSAGASPPPEEAVGMRYFALHLPDREALADLVEHAASAGIHVASNEGTYWVTDPSGIRIALVTAGHLP